MGKENIYGWRVSVICYTRDSVSQYFIRKNKTDGPAIEHLIQVYGSFGAYRRSMKSLIEEIKNQNIKVCELGGIFLV